MFTCHMYHSVYTVKTAFYDLCGRRPACFSGLFGKCLPFEFEEKKSVDFAWACLSDPRFTDHLPFKTVIAAPRGDRKKQFLLYTRCIIILVKKKVCGSNFCAFFAQENILTTKIKRIVVRV